MQKIILVTGGNRGIGKEICRQLGLMGHTVLLGSRDLDKGWKVANDLEGDVVPKKLDLTSSQDIHALAEDIKDEYEHVDVLINNAGVISSSGSLDAEMSEIKRVMDTNFFGVWELSQALIPLLMKSKDGRIVNMSSGMGAQSDLIGGYAAYRMSKYALNGLTMLMSNELNGKVLVNAMCPGWVRTDMGGVGASRSVEQGADTAVWLATTNNPGTGKFFRDRKVISW